MRSLLSRALTVFGLILGVVIADATAAVACPFRGACPVGLDNGAATVSFEGDGVAAVVGVSGLEAGQYAYRMLDRCLAAAETRDYCSPTDVRTCPEQAGRVIGFFVV